MLVILAVLHPFNLTSIMFNSGRLKKIFGFAMKDIYYSRIGVLYCIKFRFLSDSLPIDRPKAIPFFFGF